MPLVIPAITAVRTRRTMHRLAVALSGVALAVACSATPFALNAHRALAEGDVPIIS